MSRRIRRPPPGQQPSATPSWAKDFSDATDPKATPQLLHDLRERYQEATSQHQQRQADSILRAVARNPNLAKADLAHLSLTGWHGEVACNPALAKLALESPDWCKEELGRPLLKLALPDLYDQVIAEQEAKRARWDKEREERRVIYLVPRSEVGESPFAVDEDEEDETENPRFGGDGGESEDDDVPW